MLAVLLTDVSVLRGDFLPEGGVVRVGRVVFGAVAKNVEIDIFGVEVEFYRVACDAQVFKTRAEQ